MATIATITVTGVGMETMAAERAYIAQALSRAAGLIETSVPYGGTVTIDTSYGVNSGSCTYNPVATK